MYIERVKTINLEKGSIKVSCKNITFYISLDLNLLKQKKKDSKQSNFASHLSATAGVDIVVP